MEQINTEGRKLFEERLKFADKYMIYNRRCPDQQRRVHAIADVHTHLSDFYSISPRIGFWSAQGGCGKSLATEISYFFVQNPMLERNSGAGLLREIHHKVNVEGEYLPTILFDEVQNVLNPNGGNTTVADMLACYTKGAKRTIWDDGKSISLDPFCPVFTNGLTSKYEIPANYLERNISIFLERPLPEEQHQKEMWLFSLLQQTVEKDGIDGPSELRDPWMRWASKIDREEMKNDQAKIIEHLKSKIDNGRQLQLCLPLGADSVLSRRRLLRRADRRCCMAPDQPRHKAYQRRTTSVRSARSNKRLRQYRGELVSANGYGARQAECHG